MIIAVSLSLSFSNTNSLSWNRFFYQYLCTSSYQIVPVPINLAIFVVKFPFFCITVVLTIIWLFLQDTQIPFCWCFLLTLQLGQLQRLLSDITPHGNFSESPPITLEKVFNPPIQKKLLPPHFLPIITNFTVLMLLSNLHGGFQVRGNQTVYRSPARFVSSSPQNQVWKNGIELWESKLGS